MAVSTHETHTHLFGYVASVRRLRIVTEHAMMFACVGEKGFPAMTTIGALTFTATQTW
jgi:hypothetical protein